MHTLNLTVTIKQVYGMDTVYPACATSRALCALTGRKTFTHADIHTLQGMGYTLTPMMVPSATEALLLRKAG